MYWESALTSAIEVGIAIAGFSGIVAVLGRRGQGEWSELERVRLRALLGASFAAVLFAFIPLVLLSAEVSASSTWRLASLALGLSFATVGVRRWFQFKSVSPSLSGQEAFTFSLMSVVIALVLTNAVVLGDAWPYLVGVLAALTIAAGQFVRLLVDLQR